MTTQDPRRGPLPPPADLQGMEVQDATGAPLGRVEDVYVERERPATRYVALAADESGHHRPVPIECVRMEREGVVVALASEHLGDAPTVACDATVTREHEGQVAKYYRDLHEAGYMQPRAEPPELHGAGYMRPEQEPPEVGGAGRMDPRYLSDVKHWRE